MAGNSLSHSYITINYDQSLSGVGVFPSRITGGKTKAALLRYAVLCTCSLASYHIFPRLLRFSPFNCRAAIGNYGARFKRGRMNDREISFLISIEAITNNLARSIERN